MFPTAFQSASKVRACAARRCLELGEGHLDGTEIGTVRRQEEEPGAPVGEAAGSLRAFPSNRELIENVWAVLYKSHAAFGK